MNTAPIAESPPRAPPTGGSRPTLAEAQAYCRAFARSHEENFTVGSWLLPRRLRQHFANVYAYCRWADDLADETGDAEQNLARLDAWDEQLRACYSGRAEHPIFIALAQTIREFDVPIEPLADLLSAFRQDQRVKRYERFDDLLDYCRRSANPVGRLVLRLGRCCDGQTTPPSDSICTGLQLVNFWQDVARDWRERGRIYLPSETMRRFGCREDAIERGCADDAFRAAIAFEVDRAESYLQAGWPLVRQVPRGLRVEVELFLRAGLAVAAAIRRQRYDVLARRPRVSKWTRLRLLLVASRRAVV